MRKIHTNEKLILELQRFYHENGNVPILRNMMPENGYPSYRVYQKRFGSWNNALELAGFEINKTYEIRTGTETCCKCGSYLKQGQYWQTKGLPKGQVMCISCYYNPDYKNGNLNKNSNVGKATISEQIVKNVLNLEDKYDCNFTYGFNHPVDLYHKNRYKYINVKDSTLHNEIGRNLRWKFSLIQPTIPDTYIMLGYDEDRKNIVRVWICNYDDDFIISKKTRKILKYKSISNTLYDFKEAEPWEVDYKPYNDMLHELSRKRKETKGEKCFLNNDDLIV